MDTDIAYPWCMAFEIDIGFVSSAGTKESNEDFCGAMLPEPDQEGMGAIAAVADGVSRDTTVAVVTPQPPRGSGTRQKYPGSNGDDAPWPGSTAACD